ncbi:MAG: CPBP family intramembrane metalloprotease [Lachnospiraceae bacterium]|nr:CPBP family intramembrane metalloprotease [Lachnospiraceae bacterium]
MNWVLHVLSPMLIYLLVSECTAILCGSFLDSAACTALSAFLMLFAALWMYRRDAALHRHPLGKRQPNNTLQQSLLVQQRLRFAGIPVLCFLAGGILNIAWSGVLNWLKITSYFSNQAQESLLGSGLVMQLLGPGLLVPIAEELTFRGLVYTRMKERLSTGQSVFFSSLLFAFIHGNPIQIIYAFPMAVLLALLYQWNEGLAAPILFHMGANLAAILLP